MGISDAMFSGDPLRRLTELERQVRNLTSGRRLEDASIGARGVRLFAGGSLTVEGGGDIIVDDEGDIIITGGTIVARDINGETIFAVDTADPASIAMNIGAEGSINVSGGGSVTIGDGGELVMLDEFGTQIFKIGKVQFGEYSTGMRLSFDSGNAAFTLGGTPGQQAWALWDRNANYIVTNDAVTGYGLARPYLNYRIVPSFDAQGVGEGSVSLWPSTTNTSATKLMQGVNPIWHPRVSVGVATSTIGGGSVAWRLDVGGTTVASGTGGGSQTVTLPGWGTTYVPGNTYGFDLYANCSGGATRAWIQCDRLFGTQS